MMRPPTSLKARVMSTQVQIENRPIDSLNGLLVAAVQFVLALIVLWFAYGFHVAESNGTAIALLAGGVLIGGLMLSGYYTLEPNQAGVMSLFGNYVGTVSDTGLRWNNPFYSKAALSLRSVSFETDKLKVNDKDGNPIEISAILVWRVEDPASAIYAVDDYEDFVHTQSDSALRDLAMRYAYDAHDDKEKSLRGDVDDVVRDLVAHLKTRVAAAGVGIVEARLNHLAYAPEIAGAMLQRQQASAIVAARSRIVEGAVGMVKMALEQLKAEGVVDLDEERKAQMVANLLVVLCSDRAAQPVVNAGSIHG